MKSDSISAATKPSIGCVIGALLWFAGGLCDAAGPIRYQVHDIGVLPGGFGTVGHDINNLGESAGIGYRADGSFRAVIYQRRRLEEMALLPGFAESFASAINDRTEVVGTQYTEGYSDFTGFLWRDGQMFELTALIGIAGPARPVDINNHGHIVGYWYQPGTIAPEGFLFANGRFTLLPKLVADGVVLPASINDRGEIVGSATTDGILFGTRAFLFRNGQIQNLGVLPRAATSAAYSINNAGTIVGITISVGSEGYRGFVYRDGEMRDVGALPGFESTLLRQINNREEIVGTCSRKISSTPYAIWESRAVLIAEGAIQDLNDMIPPGSAWLLSSALAINDRGEITGLGERHGNGEQRAVILTPVGQAKR